MTVTSEGAECWSLDGELVREWRVDKWYDAWRVAMDKPCYHMWDGLLLGVRLYTILESL